jgi:sigma-B regulation protein RsbU (phosphoserine phosphatase)
MDTPGLPIIENKTYRIDPSKFRIIIIITGILICAITGYNFYRNAATVFSGTYYMSLPSNLYIAKDLEANKIPDIDTGAGKIYKEIIPAGSFLLEINGIKVNSREEVYDILSKMKKDSVIQMRVFNFNKSELLKNMDAVTRYIKLSEIYEINPKQMLYNSLRYMKGPIFMAIERDGATDRAGIKSGDVLLDINGKELNMRIISNGEMLTMESLKYLRSFQSGEPVYYKILRNNTEMILEVRLAVFGIPLEMIFVLITGLPFLILGLFLALKRPDNISARFACYILILMGFQILSSPSLYAPEFDVFSYIKIYLNNIAGICMMPVVLHCLNYFPEPNPGMLRKKYFSFLPYIITLPGVLLFSYWYFTDYTKIMPYIFEIPVAISLIFYITIQILNRKYESEEYRKKALPIRVIWIAALIVAYIPTISGLLGFKVTWLNYVFIFNIVIPAVYLDTIRRFKLFDIGLKIRRNIQYLLISFFWKGLILIAFLYLLSVFSKINFQFPNINMVLLGSKIEVLSIPLDELTNAFYNKIFFLAISFSAGLVLFKTGMAGIRFFEKKYYRQKFDYKQAQTELVKLMSSKFTLESLSKVIIEKISGLVRLKRTGAIFFKDEKEIWGDKSYCYDSLKHTDYCFDIREDIIGILKQFKKPFPVEYMAGEFKTTLIEHGFKYIVPFRTKQRILGALFIGEKLSETQLNNEDVEFLDSIISSASVAVENAFLYEELTEQERYKQELQIAHRIQMASLPQRVPYIKGLDISAISLPAFEVGGDFYDFLNGQEGKITVVVGDVSGKGTSAALYMSKIQGILQTLNEFSSSPEQLLVKANRLIYKNIDSKSFITAVGASFDTNKNELFLARAGHLPIYFLNNKKVSKIQPQGIGIGLSGEEIFNENLEQRKINFITGDVFFFVSDGITESVNNSGEQYGEYRLIEFIEKNSYLSSKQMCDGIMSSVKQFSDEMKQFDDMTVVVVKAE